MIISGKCVYTIKDPDRLHETWVGGGAGTYEENTNWASGLSIVEAAKKANEHVPVLFGSATRIDVLLFCGLILDVIVERKGENSWQTQYSFSNLTAIPSPHPITELRSLTTGKAISSNYIRPYVPCVTPDWVSAVFRFSEQRA